MRDAAPAREAQDTVRVLRVQGGGRVRDAAGVLRLRGGGRAQDAARVRGGRRARDAVRVRASEEDDGCGTPSTSGYIMRGTLSYFSEDEDREDEDGRGLPYVYCASEEEDVRKTRAGFNNLCRHVGICTHLDLLC